MKHFYFISVDEVDFKYFRKELNSAGVKSKTDCISFGSNRFHFLSFKYRKNDKFLKSL